MPTREEAEALSDAELISRLVTIRGVGQWTVEMLLIFSLGRLDVFPLDDFGARKGLKIAFGLETMPSKREMLALTECWRPYRSIGTWYCGGWSQTKRAPANVPQGATRRAHPRRRENRKRSCRDGCAHSPCATSRASVNLPREGRGLAVGDLISRLSACASTTASAVTLTMPRAVTDGVTMCAGRVMPSNIGPTCKPSPNTLARLKALLAASSVGMTSRFAEPCRRECGKMRLRMVSLIAASACISPSTSRSGARSCSMRTASRIFRADGVSALPKLEWLISATFGLMPSRETSSAASRVISTSSAA